MPNMNKPEVIYAYAILLDNKIETWKITRSDMNSVYEFKGLWKMDRISEYKLEKTHWICENTDEVFNKLAPDWFRKWEHATDYSLCRAYD